MRKCSEKLLAILMVTAMTCGLAACGGNDDGGAQHSSEPKESNNSDAGNAKDVGEDEGNSAGGSESTTTRISEEEITIKITGPQPGGLSGDWKNLAVIEEYANRLGIRVECEFYKTDWSTQRTLMFAEDALPDMIVNAGISIGDLNEWAEEGYLLNLKDYIDLMPNMQKVFKEYPALEAYVTASDGGIYGLAPINIDLTDRLTRTYINKNWLENLNLEVPTSIDELYDVLVAFKEQDANGNGDPNDEVPFLYQGSGNYETVDRTLMEAFGIYTGNTGYSLQADGNGKVYLAQTTDAYKEYLKFMHKLYEEGLMEQGAYTLTEDEIMDKQQGDVYGFFGTWGAPFVLARQDISYDANWMGVAGMSSSVKSDWKVGLNNYVGGNINWVVSADTEHPEEIVKFIDYFYSEEGRLAATRGYEGVTFETYHDEDLDYDYPKMYCPEGYANEDDYRVNGAVINGGFNVVEVNSVRAALFEVPMETLLKDEVVNTYGWAAMTAYANRRTGIEFTDVFPTIAYTTEEADTRATLTTDIGNYLGTAKAGFIIGELNFESDWDKYVETINGMDLEELLAIEQGAYDRYLSVTK